MTRETEHITFTLREDGVMEIVCQPGTTMTLELGKLSTQVISELIGTEARPLLCDLTNVVKMNQDCRKYFAGPEHAKVFTRCALIITSPISRIIGNFFLGANKPIRPTRLFTNVGEGLKWLKEKS